MKNKNKKNLGFTLIELLITVTITLILLGNAIAFFLDYLDQRSVSDAVDELKVYIQRAESAASSGDLGGCDHLGGYRLSSVQVGNLTTISLQAECVAGTPDPAVTFELTDNVEISPDLDYLFKVLHGGVDIPGGLANQTITISNDNHSFAFTLYREGRFSAGDWL